mmetsp:Transcript_66118/g.158176  ORF Transcript_66118/g.158176 Transcript_66118/m.158176 type:complete len:325 (+) Transcript_66118:118-1092(+)
MTRSEERGDREREKDKKKKKRRSASSESAERSREREKRRRKQQQEYVNKNRKPTGGGMDPAAPGQRMFWDGFQWVPRTDTGSSVNPNDINASRKLRRLYLGSLPYHLGVTEDSFSKQLYETMKERGMCNDPNQNPVLHVWFARDKGANYGFCEVASIEETERALQLDGMLVLGVPVSIKRPSDATSPMGMVGNLAPGVQMNAGGMLALPAMQVQATSTIIRIEEILKVDSKTTKDDYDDVVEDMNEGCGAHGKIFTVFIVKPEHVQMKPHLKAGDVFLTCKDLDDATKIMRAMGHRKYDGRQIQMKSFSEDDYNRDVKPLVPPA